MKENNRTSSNPSILLGYVLFSEDCVKKIYENSLKKNFNVFGRKTSSSITGCAWGELFAFYIPQEFKEYFINGVNKINDLYIEKKLTRFSGWEIISYIYAEDKDDTNIHTIILDILEKKKYPESFVVIDDETEDFDFPNDYVMYLKRIIPKLRTAFDRWI